jgi:hypothetical protein
MLLASRHCRLPFNGGDESPVSLVRLTGSEILEHTGTGVEVSGGGTTAMDLD